MVTLKEVHTYARVEKGMEAFRLACKGHFWGTYSVSKACRIMFELLES